MKKTTKQVRPKLTLKVETLRLLNEKVLTQVNGGAGTYNSSCCSVPGTFDCG